MSEKEEMTFGNRVKEIRKRLKLSQEEFGKGIGVCLQHISKIEKNQTKPGHDFFYKIVIKYGVNLWYLLFNEGEMFEGERKKGEVIRGDIKTGNPETDELFYYILNSELVRHHMLYDFKKLMGEDGDSIKRLMKKPKAQESEK